MMQEELPWTELAGLGEGSNWLNRAVELVATYLMEKSAATCGTAQVVGKELKLIVGLMIAWELNIANNSEGDDYYYHLDRRGKYKCK